MPVSGALAYNVYRLDVPTNTWVFQVRVLAPQRRVQVAWRRGGQALYMVSSVFLSGEVTQYDYFVGTWR